MTAKDFHLIAGVIRNVAIDEAARKRVAAQFAEALADSHERFDVDRFLAACKP